MEGMKIPPSPEQKFCLPLTKSVNKISNILAMTYKKFSLDSTCVISDNWAGAKNTSLSSWRGTDKVNKYVLLEEAGWIVLYIIAIRWPSKHIHRFKGDPGILMG